ncbi:sigma factor-like helix-turn-helix DNA-binding protein [Sphingomonas sp. SUN019]|uniref:sigma factor-like helix-turn-helix DNA-binding protein n=1 Tax=Sphingomonas sp. SUN019 TaxID=2937788 RepID=UPI0038D404ED
MFRLEGKPQKEIAAALGISVSAVEKHVYKAYKSVVDAQARLEADKPLSRRL